MPLLHTVWPTYLTRRNASAVTRDKLPSPHMALSQGVSYGVFGLGNKQYEHFCAVGHKVHASMEQLGAQPVVRRGDGDDDVDIDADFESWRTELYTSLDASSLLDKKEVPPAASCTFKRCYGSMPLLLVGLSSFCRSCIADASRLSTCCPSCSRFIFIFTHGNWHQHASSLHKHSLISSSLAVYT